MTKKNKDKTRARALQEETGWSYSECLRLVRTKTEEQIDDLIECRVDGTDLGLALTELEQEDPTVAAAAAEYDETVKRIIAKEKPPCPECGAELYSRAFDGKPNRWECQCGYNVTIVPSEGT